MPTLDWIGKSKVVNHHLDVPYCVLDRKYSYDENGQHEEDNSSENMNIAEMSREELVRLIAEKSDMLELNVLKAALDRIDILDGKVKTVTKSEIEAINDEAFDDLPLEEQWKKLMKASQSLSEEAKKYGLDIKQKALDHR